MMTPSELEDSSAAAEPRSEESPKDIARRLYDEGMRCNCDLDNWEPERRTGHSWVCRIHKAAMARHLTNLAKGMKP